MTQQYNEPQPLRRDCPKLRKRTSKVHKYLQAHSKKSLKAFLQMFDQQDHPESIDCESDRQKSADDDSSDAQEENIVQI